MNWFSSAIDRIKSLLNGFQAKQFFAVVLVSVLLLTTNANLEKNAYGQGSNKASVDKVLKDAHENDSPRPKTMREWEKDSRETANNPGERYSKIGEQTGAALKEFGGGYVDAVKDSATDAKDSVARAGSKVADQMKD